MENTRMDSPLSVMAFKEVEEQMKKSMSFGMKELTADTPEGRFAQKHIALGHVLQVEVAGYDCALVPIKKTHNCLTDH